MPVATRKKSTGKAGEEAARWFFHRHKWHMTKVESSVRCHTCGAHSTVGRKNGLADFIGYVMCEFGPAHSFDSFPLFRACEVKEATGDTMKASRLSPEQRAYMADLPPGSAHVGIFWQQDGRFELFPFVPRGSYRRGEGTA